MENELTNGLNRQDNARRNRKWPNP